MQFASALSRDLQTEAAVTEVLEAVTQRLPDQHAHISFVFASPHHLKTLSTFLPVVQERLSSHTLLGCTGGGVIGDRQEVENRPALALMAALPGVTVALPYRTGRPGGVLVGDVLAAALRGLRRR